MQGSSMENSILNKQPYFTLKIKSQNIGFYIIVNGADVFEYFSSDNLVTELPINHWFTSGSNKLEVIAKPFSPNKVFNKKSQLLVTLLVAGADNLGEKLVVSDIYFDAELNDEGRFKNKNTKSVTLDSENKFLASNKGDVVIKSASLRVYNEEKGFVRINRELYLPSILPRWSFLDGDQIPSFSEEDMSDKEFDVFQESLLSHYRKLFDAIKQNKIDDVMYMFEERNRETDQAFYYEPGTTERKLREGLKDAARDEAAGETKLLPIDPEYLEFGVFESNTMARLKRTDDSRAIAQNFTKFPGSQSFDLIFRYKNGKWILTR